MRRDKENRGIRGKKEGCDRGRRNREGKGKKWGKKRAKEGDTENTGTMNTKGEEKHGEREMLGTLCIHKNNC